jgi:dipeptidyl aminopeptidase/acylaminoacyl peptidase
MTIFRFSVLILSVFLTRVNFAQKVPNASTLRLDEIMKGNEFIGHQPENIRWSIDGSKIYFDWNPKNEPGNSTYEFNPRVKGSTPVLADPKTILKFDPNQHAYLDQYQIIDGSLTRYDQKTKQLSRIYSSSSNLHSVQRANNSSIVYFQSDLNLFRFNIEEGSILQLTDFRIGDEPDKKKDSTFLMKQQSELFEFIRDKNERDAWRKSKETNFFEDASPFYIGKEQLENLQIHPNGQFISFRLSDYPKETDTKVEHHISSNGYTYPTSARAKVGAEEPIHKLGILDLKKDTVYFVNLSKLSDIRKKPAYLNDTVPYDKDRKVVMHSLKFAKSRYEAVCDVRSYDNKDRWIILIDLSTGQFNEIDHQHDEAWIGGPGISNWNEEEGTLGWLNDDLTVYFQSEVTGYSHLYLHTTSKTIKTKLRTRAITSGTWEIHGVSLSNDGRFFYLTANRSHPGNRDLLKLEIETGKITTLLDEEGYHDVSLSPDEKTLAIRFSNKNTPWELYTAANTEKAKKNRITYSTSKEFKSYNWRQPKVITFSGSDGKEVYARLYEPNKETANKAAVIFVHGAGYLQNAHNYWSNYHREYMFHNLLADNGFTVLDIDYRASEGYGRDYRTAVYRHMGGRDLQDHLDGKNYLVKTLGIDSNRIGIYGGSYGGFITLMALLTKPGEFQCGAALRSVTDWAHYNHEYTSNILNYPETDPEAYRKSSPIYFAENLKDRLLMLHGMVDDNVQFQDVVRLSQRFIELHKENWELAVFPVEAHGFKESYSWYDEYRRIYELFYEELVLKKK